MKYAKAIAALCALGAVVAQALVDGSVSPAEWGYIATAASAAAAVWRTPNKPT